ncbi:hypothetical protein CP09DC77_0017 [Chlamydia psittaci 09DC77]|nr:hypothetical protein CP09DC77_0017 [Chlamydia psittaci 09DC77]
MFSELDFRYSNRKILRFIHCFLFLKMRIFPQIYFIHWVV